MVRALQWGDTLALNALVPNSVVPVTERLAVQQTGCASLGEALMRLRKGASPPTDPTGLPPNAIVQGHTVFSAGDADTLMRSTSQLKISGHTIEITVALAKTGYARQMASIRGLLAGICGVGSPTAPTR